jgi:DNA mismatch repair protein MutL
MKIKVLSEGVISKIAAGEVVERPASVVKELLENAIDAGAREITCEVKSEGLWYIRVEDNGCGMTQEDLHLALKRYATSKISRFEDLSNIETLGFRGEALPSISSVSRLEIHSKKEDDISGSYIKLEGGKVLEEKEIGCPTGTSVEVIDLFFNIPARRKFLKSVRTELQQVQHQIILNALSHPQISFKYIHQGSTLLHLPRVNELDERIYNLFGKDFLEKLIFVEGEGITGYLSRPEFLRFSRSHQFLFINNRPFQHRSLTHAIYSSYGSFEKGRYPAFIIFLKIEPSLIDVNVHPTKREVRFHDERGVHEAVRQKVKSAVQPRDWRGMEEEVRGRRKEWKEFPDLGSIQNIPEKLIRQQKDTSLPLFSEESGADYSQEKDKDTQLLKGQTLSLPFWQLHRLYIFAQTQSGTIIVDQHNAHERVIFEEVVKVTERRERITQNLLFPIVLDLTPREWEILEENYDFIQKLGFVLKKMSGRTLSIDGIPLISINFRNAHSFGEKDMRDLLDEMSSPVGSGVPRLRNFENVARSFACKAAIKKGESLSPDEMNSLLDRLFATEHPYLCPHGRPIIIRMTLEELDRKFGRL